MPLADALTTDVDLANGEERYGLTVVFCSDCYLVQILETVDDEVLYGRNYPYYSSFSPALLKHSRVNALSLIETRHLGPQSLVIELASNDGYLLKNFKEKGIPVLGIDPAEGPAAEAVKIGVPTICDYFGTELAGRLQADGTQADVVIGNNVLAHVSDLNGFVGGIAKILKPGGVTVIEAPYLKDLIDRCEFDTIYHEHHCYFSVSALAKLFARHGLTLADVQHLPIHGGSLRLFVTHESMVSDAVKAYLADEENAGMKEFAYYGDFGQRVAAIKQRLVELLTDLKSRGHSIAAYGAAAKGATLLNYTGVDAGYLDFVVDRNVHKHGAYMPGVRVPVKDPGALLTEKPDYVLMLAWNFSDEILRQQEEYSRRGGRWIVPIPFPVVLDEMAVH